MSAVPANLAARGIAQDYWDTLTPAQQSELADSCAADTLRADAGRALAAWIAACDEGSFDAEHEAAMDMADVLATLIDSRLYAPPF